MTIKLYHHKTDGGAEYLTDKFIKWSHNGKSGKEGVFKNANYIVRIDGDITKDAELSVRQNITQAEIVKRLKKMTQAGGIEDNYGIEEIIRLISDIEK